jgi:hypothetical protein
LNPPFPGDGSLFAVAPTALAPHTSGIGTPDIKNIQHWTNSRRCGRTHCRYTGPYYLGMIGPVLMLASSVVSAGFFGWLILVVLILTGGKII